RADDDVLALVVAGAPREEVWILAAHRAPSPRAGQSAGRETGLVARIVVRVIHAPVEAERRVAADAEGELARAALELRDRLEHLSVARVRARGGNVRRPGGRHDGRGRDVHRAIQLVGN